MSSNPVTPKQYGSPSWKKKLLFGFIVTAFFYLILEVVVSSVAAWRYHSRPISNVWIFEESSKTFQFDPVLGYRLTQTSSRTARIDNGELEYLGVYRGNKQGFPDADDFTIKKPSKEIKRYLVLGDSYSAAQYIQMNWPDYVEKHDPSHTLQLYNLSTDGGGLGNWWSNLIRFAGEQGYEFDGVIFAVWGDDLERGFTLADDHNTDRHLLGRVASWNPKDFPKTLEEARTHLKPLNGFVLSHDEFEQVLRDKALHRSLPKKKPQEYIWIAYNTFRLLREMVRTSTEPTRPVLQEGQIHLINEVKTFLDQRGIQPFVVRVPPKYLQEGQGHEEKVEAPLRAFTQLLNARSLDGNEAFRGLSQEELKKCWFPYDGHWNQKGSDQFGQWMLEQLLKEQGKESKPDADGRPAEPISPTLL
jgi:hypothetical protein